MAPKSTRTGRFTKKTAGERDANLQKAYDLLREKQIPFYNIKISQGRSLRPTIGISMGLHDKLRRLADEVRLTRTMPSFRFFSK